jgi:hypothetical protein
MPVRQFFRPVVRCPIVLTALLALPATVAADQNPGVTCSISVTPLTFGEHISYGRRATDSTATILVDCTTPETTPLQFEGSIRHYDRNGSPA